MATAKQIESNRKNALKSTGPTSQEGKTGASMNATKHGILSSKVLLPDEDPAEFQAFTDKTVLALQPVGEIETLLANRIVIMAWRLRRAVVVEGGLFEKDPLDFMESDSLGNTFRHRAEFFSVLSRYETGIERSLYRALHELQRLQAFRNGMAVPLPVAIDIQSEDDRHGE